MRMKNSLPREGGKPRSAEDRLRVLSGALTAVLQEKESQGRRLRSAGKEKKNAQENWAYELWAQGGSTDPSRWRARGIENCLRTLRNNSASREQIYYEQGPTTGKPQKKEG